MRAEATAGGAVDTTQQVVRALQLLCGMATARGHYLLPELTRRGLLEAAVRGAQLAPEGKAAGSPARAARVAEVEQRNEQPLWQPLALPATSA